MLNCRCGNLGAVVESILSPVQDRSGDRPLSWEGIIELHLRIFKADWQLLKTLAASVSTFKGSFETDCIWADLTGGEVVLDRHVHQLNFWKRRKVIANQLLV